MDLEHVERDEAVNLPEPAAPSVAWSWDRWDERNLPVETEAAPAVADPARTLQELRAFHLYGRRPADAPATADATSFPALLHHYRDLTRVRHDFPVCVDGADPASAIRSLAEWTDHAVEAQGAEGDAAEVLRRNAYRLEAVVRSLAAEKEGERLGVLWDRAAATLLETSRLSPEKEQLLRDHVAKTRKALAGDSELVACGPGAALRMLRASAAVFWRERSGAWVEELDGLIRGLENILAADDSRSEAARSPQALGESLATAGEDVDASAMAELLARRKPESGLPAERRKRIRTALEMMTRMRPVFGVAPAGATHALAPVRFDAVLDDCAAAVAEERARASLMTDFFRAVRIARLEAQNRYRPDLHDAYFHGFDERYLTAEERALCPPVLVRVSDEALSHAETGVLLGILNATAPIKVLVELRSLYAADGDEDFPRIRLAGAARLASMAMALHQVYVLQAPLSRVGALRARVLDGLRYAGPALFCVYAPAAGGDAAGAAYLRAAAAAESRFFPLLVFDPARGEALADRVDLGDNAQPARNWPEDAFAFKRAGGEDAAVTVGFTPADYLFCDRALSGHFWHVGATRWHDNLTPVHEYLEMNAEQAAGKIPYLLTVDREGRLGRAVVSRAVVDAALQCRAFWRGLRDAGGVDSSFARRALAAEKAKLEADKQREIDAIEKNYIAQLETDVGELTKEIVQRIAGQLMGAEGVAFVARPAAPAASASPAPAAASAPVSAASAAVEEEEKVSFDDAYIDTPLCTSCNECTQLNARMFAYNGNKQAEVKDAGAGPFSDLVRAAELCPVHIIHPGKPKNPDEPGLADWIARAAKFN